MATGRVRVEKDYIDLDLHLVIKIHPQPKKDVLKSANSILRNIMQLEYRRIENHLNKRYGKELLSIIHVRLDEKWNGTIKTVIKSRKALHELFLLCKRPLDKNSNNEFTELLTEFFPKYPLNEKCVFPPQTNITFNVDIPGKRFEKAKKFFKEKARKIKESEASSEMVGSIRTCYSSETEDIDEGSALPANGGNIQWLMHKFIVASPKGNACSKICVKSAEITQLNDALKQYNDCPEMFYIDAVLPTDAFGCYEYQFITKSFFRATTTKRKTFHLLNKLIHRDIHEPKTCILSHLRHIICSTEESNLVNACIEIENLCEYDNNIAMDAIPELLQCQNKLSDIGNLKLVITISFIKKYNLEFLNTIITPSQAKLFIAPLLKTSLQQLPCSCAEYMPFSCFQMYMMAHGNDLSICRFLFDFYHFFDDNAMIDTVTLLASKHCPIALEDDLDIIVDLFQKLNVSESSAIAILQKQVFTKVDLLMGINIHKKLLKKRSLNLEKIICPMYIESYKHAFKKNLVGHRTVIVCIPL